MKSIFLIMIFIFGILAANRTRAAEFVLKEDGHERKIRFQESERTLYYCPQAKPCEAREWMKKKVAIGDLKTSDRQISLGNLACHQVGGSTFILEDKKHNETDFCGFKDQSMILSVDLLIPAAAANTH